MAKMKKSRNPLSMIKIMKILALVFGLVNSQKIEFKASKLNEPITQIQATYHQRIVKIRVEEQQKLGFFKRKSTGDTVIFDDASQAFPIDTMKQDLYKRNQTWEEFKRKKIDFKKSYGSVNFSMTGIGYSQVHRMPYNKIERSVFIKENISRADSVKGDCDDLQIFIIKNRVFEEIVYPINQREIINDLKTALKFDRMLEICKNVGGFLNTDSLVCLFEMRGFQNFSLEEYSKLDKDNNILVSGSWITGNDYKQHRETHEDLKILTKPTKISIGEFEEHIKSQFNSFAGAYIKQITCQFKNRFKDDIWLSDLDKVIDNLRHYIYNKMVLEQELGALNFKTAEEEILPELEKRLGVLHEVNRIKRNETEGKLRQFEGRNFFLRFFWRYPFSIIILIFLVLNLKKFYLDNMRIFSFINRGSTRVSQAYNSQI